MWTLDNTDGYTQQQLDIINEAISIIHTRHYSDLTDWAWEQHQDSLGDIVSGILTGDPFTVEGLVSSIEERMGLK